MTKQALDIEAGDVIIVSGFHELVHSVYFNNDGTTITIDRVHCLESFQVNTFDEIQVVGKW